MKQHKASLVILAAGMGSRYGGLKQLDSFGPNGETIIDYSIYDAIQAGFTKIVFIVRDSFRKEIEQKMQKNWGDQAELHFVCQELNLLPAGFTCPDQRTKPWGTAHAVWVAKDIVKEPFGVINADDYYGREALSALFHFLQSDRNHQNEYAVIAYLLRNTLSEFGAVNRGVCLASDGQFLRSIEECKGIFRNANGLISLQDQADRIFQEDTPVSMNMWAFGVSYFDHSEKYFIQFLQENLEKATSEFYIPDLIQKLIDEKIIQVHLIKSPSQWFGVTYQEDRPMVQQALQKLIEENYYPKTLF
ncbi:MAG: nucleotidyltransferase [Saprospiraceae bacterium]|nr:nucleotidyltransferase [Saprospiraceae bacterium]